MELRNFNTLIRPPPKINSYTSVNSYLSGNLLSQLDLPHPTHLLTEAASIQPHLPSLAPLPPWAPRFQDQSRQGAQFGPVSVTYCWAYLLIFK